MGAHKASCMICNQDCTKTPLQCDIEYAVTNGLGYNAARTSFLKNPIPEAGRVGTWLVDRFLVVEDDVHDSPRGLQAHLGYMNVIAHARPAIDALCEQEFAMGRVERYVAQRQIQSSLSACERAHSYAVLSAVVNNYFRMISHGVAGVLARQERPGYSSARSSHR